MGRYHYAATTPTWHQPRSTDLEWIILYVFVLDMFCQVMSLVPVIGYWLWLIGLALSLVVFALVVILLRFGR